MRMQILPGTGRGTMRSMVVGARHTRCIQPQSPSTTPLRVPRLALRADFAAATFPKHVADRCYGTHPVPGRIF
jgi:hypothetical protein